MTSDLHEIYQRLFDAFGPQHWWPGETPLEVMVGAVLVQNTNWKNVELAIENLKEADLLSLEAIHELGHEELAELIRPAGYYRLKATRLKNLLEFVFERYDGSIEAMAADDIQSLREGLLSVKGVGPETADSIALYAAGKPTFVVDNYTARVWKRHGWIEYEADYYTLKEHFESGLDRDAQLFNEYHALIVRVGKEFCGKTPKCEACPLASLLPEGGVQEGF
jgi:endonuclease-3 related protein